MSLPPKDGDGLVKLSNQESLLHDLLSQRDARLGGMYMGALVVLADTDNPEARPLAAHNFREIMEKIPEYIGMRIRNTSLKSTVDSLKIKWEKHKKSKKTSKEDKNFISECEKFFAWYEEFSPGRSNDIAKALKKIQSSTKRHLPSSLEKLQVDQWNTIGRYFIDVAHHRVSQEEINEFPLWKEAMEVFLLDQFYPRTFDDHRKILSVIEEGEKNGNP